MFLGQKIRNLRQDRGVTLTSLAHKLGVSPSYLSGIERNLKKPTLPLLQKISETLHIPVSYLLMEPTDSVTGEKLKSIREARGLSLEDLSDISEISIDHLDKFENNLDSPSQEDLAKIAEALNVTISVFVDKTENKNQLGKRIRDLRKQQGLKVIDLAAKANVSPGLISQIENNQTTPLLNTLEDLARALNSSMWYLLMERQEVENLLGSLGPDVLELLSDPAVQTVLRTIREFDSAELKYVLNFIQFFKKNQTLLQ